MVTETDIVDYLAREGLLRPGDAEVTSLEGGVSAEVLLVRTPQSEMVVKQALEKLKVKDDWHGDVTRNYSEAQAMQFVSRFMPAAVPRVLHADRQRHLFVMEYFGQEFISWKQQLLAGELHEATAGEAARLLASLHDRAWGDEEAKTKFATTDVFYDLRIEPYLLTTGARHPRLKAIYQREAERLQHTALTLVHGDYSAKNILVAQNRHVVLDWEIAWYGDPAFDSAFLLNLLLLKSLYRPRDLEEFLRLITVFRTTYAARLEHFDGELDRRMCHLTLLLLLARIDGKSPAEYLTDERDKEFVRGFVSRLLLDQVDDFDELTATWRREVQQR